MIGAGLISPQNFSVQDKGIDVLSSGSGEGGGRRQGRFLNADVNLTGKCNVTCGNQEMMCFRQSHFPRV